MPLASRLPQHSPSTLQRASGDMHQIEKCVVDDAEEPLKYSEILRRMEEEDIARCNRGSLNKSFILPGFKPDAAHWGHSSLACHGPGNPPPGNGIGDVEMLGSAHSELHIRNAAKSLEQCKRYIELALELDARDTSNSGYTALHYAAKWDRIEVMKMLVLAGANPLLKDWEGNTAAVLARKQGNYGFTRALQELQQQAAEQAASAAPPTEGGEWYSLPEGAKGTVTVHKPSPSKRTASGSIELRQSEEMEQVMELTQQFDLSLSEMQSIQAGFNEWDHTGSGSISIADIERATQRAGLDLDMAAMQTMDAMAGEDGLISFGVFVEAAAHRIKKLRPSSQEEEQAKTKQQRVDSPPNN
eukprot:TRINITY_DN4628_c0_g1_i1.p1 TRINITY_DN4628_c0_g1~~TRINITY_DN4628_c0_g1_i1.p1  ORF type:complete len:357 (-),score=124.12 TRINITY_DN4628_c0_g1_i1:55-1125(-)